jgi:excisionase family DNA binding protein
MKRGGLLTAPEVARHCNADLKTIHNWVNAGKIRSFRTPGRHLRFHPDDVLEFMEEFGYPVPNELVQQARPNVMMISKDQEIIAGLRQKIGGRARIKTFDCPIQAMLAIGHEKPVAVVIDAGHPDVNVRSLVPKLNSVEAAIHRVVVFSTKEDIEVLAKDLASVLFAKPDVKSLSQSVIELMARAREQRSEGEMRSS